MSSICAFQAEYLLLKVHTVRLPRAAAVQSSRSCVLFDCCSLPCVQTLSCAWACALVQESEQPEGNYLQLGSVKLHCVDGEVHMVSNLKRRHVHVVRT